MRKFFAVVLSALLLAFSLVPCAGAYRSEREYFEDGSYIIVYDEDEATPESGEAFSFLKLLRELIQKIIEFLKGSKTVDKTKYMSYYDLKGKRLWTVCLSAEFSYNGKSSVCESAGTSCHILDSDWELISKDCSKSGNSASATFKFKQYKLGVSLKTIEKTITLTCDKDGNIK